MEKRGPSREEKSRERREAPRGMSFTPTSRAEWAGPSWRLMKALAARLTGWAQRCTLGGCAPTASPPPTSLLFTHTATLRPSAEVLRQS
jgi:hypothetical protein